MIVQNYYELNPQTYEDQFWWKKDDIEFWKQIFQDKNKSILELASGTGRIGLPLLREGHNYTGLDVSTEYCNYTKELFKTESYTNEIYNQSMINFKLNKKFDNIFIGFNSLLHLLQEGDVIQCLQAIKQHMSQSSSFYIDIFVPKTLFLCRPKNVAVPVLEFVDSRNNKLTYIDEIIDYNKTSQIASITWLYSYNHKQYHEKFHFSMKMFYPDKMNKLLIDNNFIIEDIWGNYKKNLFSENSKLQIYHCKLKS